MAGKTQLAENIAALRRQRGLKQSAFAELVGTDQANVSKWEGGAEPKPQMLEKLSQLAGRSISQFSNEPWQATSQPVNDATVDAADTVAIQKLDISLSMGPGTLIDDWVEAEPVAFDLRFIQSITRSPSNRLRLVTGIGDSMFPTLTYGDAIMIDTTDRALSRQDGIYWIDLYGAAGIKRLRAVGKGRVLVKSDNPTVEDQEVDAGDLRIEGRAIWVARGL